MSPRWIASFLIINTPLFTNIVMAEPHAAAPMMAVQPAQADKHLEQTVVMRKQIKAAFKKAYSKQGKPKIAVFWNRQFDDQLSQWRQEMRQTRKHEFELNSRYTDKNKKQYHNHFDAHEKQTEYSEVRQEQVSRIGMTESASYQFNSAFTSSLLTVPVRLIDRATIMRLTQHEHDQKTQIENDSDYQKIEVAALIKHADYFMEILLSDDLNAEYGWTFLVTVKSTSTGQIVAMHKSEDVSAFQSTDKLHWEATANGYEKVIDSKPLPTIENLGEELAYETMAALTLVWQ